MPTNASLRNAIVRVGRGATPTWTKLPNPQNVEFPERMPADIDVTSQDSGFDVENMVGMSPSVDWPLEFIHVENDPIVAVLTELLQRAPDTGQREVHLLEISIGGQVRVYLCYLKDYVLMKPVGDKIMAKATWRVNAQVTDLPGQAPVNTTLPAISGTVQAGQTLTAWPGIWTGSPTFTYQWQEQISSTWTNIAGATGSTLLVPGGSTVGRALRVRVTGTNGAGSATANSAATTNVIAA